MPLAMSLALASTLAAVLAAGPAAPQPAVPAPTPAAAASARPLREIGRVRARSPFCSQAIGHADSAIDTTLSNDIRIAFTIANLRSIDLDSSRVKKANGTHELLNDYTAMRATAVTGEGQVNQLRADAAAVSDEQQKADLKRFADALAGALERQKKMAADLARYIAYVDAHPPIDQNAKAQWLFDIQWAQTAPGNPFHGDPQDYVPSTLSEVAHNAADQLTLQAASVAGDEGVAADRMEPAFKTCI
jgi:hypothetical protein